MKKLNIAFCSFPDYSSNAKALYDYMKKIYNDNMNLIWVVNSEKSLQELVKNKIEVYKIGDEDYFEKMKDIDVFFTTHANIIGEKKPNSIYIELWHGISMKHIGFLSDNITPDDESWYTSVSKKVDYFIVPSDFWRVIFATRFNVKYDRVLSLGYPKLDYFINNDNKKLLSKLLNIDVSKYKKILYYMPTFHKGCNRIQESNINLENIINLENYDEDILIEYLKNNNYLLCIKKHPSEELELNQIENENVKIITDEILIKHDINLNQILNASDIMITDYSSLGVEYTFLNKPIIYCITDVEQYSKNRGITFDNFEFWSPGYKVNNIELLIKAIDDNFENNKNNIIIEQKKKLWFGDLTDGGCDKICDFLFEGNTLSSNVKKYVDKEEMLKARVDELSFILDEKNDLIKKREERIKELDNFIAEIINSKGWKILEKTRKIFSFIKR